MNQKSIEILNPFGSIYSYDLSFNFLGKRDLQEKSIHTFSRFYPLSDDSYILLPTLLGEKDAVMCFCDYSTYSGAYPFTFRQLIKHKNSL